MLWRLEPNGDDKPRKVPYTIDGRRASSTDPATWCSFEFATATLELHPDDFAGLGFALGDGLIGIDLDDVLDPVTGALTPEAAELVELLGTYGEVSPSGAGIKLFLRGDPLPAGTPHAAELPYAGRIEYYDRGRYFTVTGRRIEGAGDEVAELTPGGRERLIALLGKRTTTGNRKPAQDDNGKIVEIIPAGRRNTTMTSIAGRMRRAGLGGEDLLAGLQAVNLRRCSPPLSTQEVRAIAHSITRYSPGADDEKPLPEYQILTAAALDSAKYATEYLIPGILPARQPCVIGGPKKSLKTSVALDMAVSLAGGGFFLGKWPAIVARTLLMTGESGLPVIQETARRICHAAGRRLADLDHLFVSADLPRLDSPRHLAALDHAIEEHGVNVLLVDPLFLALRPAGQESSLYAMGSYLRDAAEVCERHGTTLILLHHAKKGVASPHEPADLDDLSWSGCAEFARSWLLIARRERYEPGTGLHRLWLTAGGSAGHSGLWGLDVDEGPYTPGEPRRWEVTVRDSLELREDAKLRRTSESQAKKKSQAEADAKRVVQELARIGTTTKTDLRDRLSLSGGRITAAVDNLLREAAVEECEVHKPHCRKKPYLAYRLRS
jgi:hypothetical protein